MGWLEKLLGQEKAEPEVLDLSEQAAGMFLRFRRMILAQRHEVTGQCGTVHLNPCGEPRIDTLGHFRRARLGKGQAEDRLRVRPVQEQAEHSAGQDLRLPRPRQGATRTRADAYCYRVGLRAAAANRAGTVAVTDPGQDLEGHQPPGE